MGQECSMDYEQTIFEIARIVDVANVFLTRSCSLYGSEKETGLGQFEETVRKDKILNACGLNHVRRKKTPQTIQNLLKDTWIDYEHGIITNSIANGMGISGQGNFV